MQLYMVAVQVKWSDPEMWRAVIAHPGGMHNVMSFVGCVGNLMKGSGVEELLGAAYSGLAGILSGKSWSRAMPAFRMARGLFHQANAYRALVHQVGIF